ncbi:2-dehydropantoate 2-reductase [Microbacterium suwonense]|uniref:2-dehydropantoate 2-reductase n=2 Tax=Microbacterium suwonense TaxID=683047 RepID=A0ABN6X292_9MICO|nr:2-dehydropantoate 2-reductase [Microbacterium suwonense]
MGCGAMGGVHAGELARAGHDVTVVDPSPAVLAQVRGEGLSIRKPDGQEYRVKLDARGTTDGIDAPDFLFFFVKAHFTAQAAREAARIIGEQTVVVTVQNGWGHGDVLAEVLPSSRIVVGVTRQGATPISPGVVLHYGSGETTLGSWSGSDLRAAQKTAELLDSAGLAASASPDALGMIWKKLVFNAGFSAVPSIIGRSAYALKELPDAMRLAVGVSAEAVQVASALGHTDITVQDHVLAPADRFFEKIEANAGAGGKPSMLVDIENRRRTEVDAINGAVLREAERLGLDLPLNRAVTALLKGIESSWEA